MHFFDAAFMIDRFIKTFKANITLSGKIEISHFYYKERNAKSQDKPKPLLLKEAKEEEEKNNITEALMCLRVVFSPESRLRSL